MGRTLPSITHLVQQQIAELKPLADGLRRSDQLILNELLDSVQPHRAAIANAAGLLPLEVMLLLIQLEERKRGSRVQDDLSTQIEKLRKEIEILKGLGP
jgi:hypothetical protein